MTPSNHYQSVIQSISFAGTTMFPVSNEVTSNTVSLLILTAIPLMYSQSGTQELYTLCHSLTDQIQQLYSLQSVYIFPTTIYSPTVRYEVTIISSLQSIIYRPPYPTVTGIILFTGHCCWFLNILSPPDGLKCT